MSRQPSDPAGPSRRTDRAAGPCNRGRSAVAHRPAPPPGRPEGPAGPIPLFGFHPAGGGTAFFSGWQRALGERIRVVPVRLPGRDMSAASHRHRLLSSLVAAVDDYLGPQLEQPYLLYGHSMGALIVYHLARLRAATGRRLPEQLLVGAYPAPHLPHPLHRAGHLSDPELTELLLDFAALPAALRGDRRWLADRIALVRADIALCESHGSDGPWPRLPCPVEVFTGAGDPLVTVPAAAAWATHTGPACTLHTLPGGHFFPRESKKQFFGALNGVLSRSSSRF